MVVCPDCGKDVTDAKFCSNCGATLKPPVEDEVDVVEDAPVEETVVDVDDEVDVVEDAPIEEGNNDIIDVEVKKESPEEEIGVNKAKKTKFCANCGREVDIGIAFCPQCGYKFTEDSGPQTKFCQSCGEKININAEICPHCGVRVANIQLKGEKSVLLSAILSFLFPGLGHLYLGLSKKGVSFIIAYIVSAILVFILIGFVLILIIWIWALIDSIKSTEAINRGEYVEDKLF